jgi:putative SOS response-associated peptidase YedK
MSGGSHLIEVVIMCGRFPLFKTGREIASHFGLDGAADWQPRYNIAPTQTILAVLNRDGRTAIPMRWGLVPPWAGTGGRPSSTPARRRPTRSWCSATP